MIKRVDSGQIMPHAPGTLDPRASGSTLDAPNRMSENDEATRDRLAAEAPIALRELLVAVYDDLHRVAHRLLADEATGHTLSTTALVHEAYLRLAGGSVAWNDRAHFFAIASRTMRHILVDYARRHSAVRRGGPAQRPIGLDEIDAMATIAVPIRSDELLALDEALTRLAEEDARLAQVVECRFFGGLTEPEIAEALGMSVRSVARDWHLARGWLHRELRGDG
jgi:RNA polymerase sigma factor (TIGR02999 family)